MPIRIVTFDLDNTLWDVNSVIIAAEREMRAWLDVHVPEFTARFDREAMLEVRKLVVSGDAGLAHDVSALRRAVLNHAIRACGYADSEASRHADNAFEVFYAARQRVEFFDNALEVLDELRGRYQLGALTNGNADIERIGLGSVFTFAFSSADVGRSKPAPDMFHAALEHCDAEARECVHVGDNLVDDIHGAAEVGMHTVWTNHAAATLEGAGSRPTREVSSLAELPQAIEDIHSS